MIESNANSVYARLMANIGKVKAFGTVQDQVTRTTLLTVLALMKKRIFENGLNANMKGMGTYSRQYYEKVRRANGWSNSNVTLELAGEMRREFTLGVDGGEWVIGFESGIGEKSYSFKYDYTGKRKSKNNPSGTKGAKKLTTTAPASGKRARDLEKRYGTVFEMSQSEISDFGKIVQFEINRRLNG